MKATAITTQSVSELPTRDNGLTRVAVARVEAYLRGESGEVREVTNPRLLAEFTAARAVGHSTVGGPIALERGTTRVSLATVKVVHGMLMLQGQVPSMGGELRTFYCGRANQIFA